MERYAAAKMELAGFYLYYYWNGANTNFKPKQLLTTQMLWSALHGVLHLALSGHFTDEIKAKKLSDYLAAVKVIRIEDGFFIGYPPTFTK